MEKRYQKLCYYQYLFSVILQLIYLFFDQIIFWPGFVNIKQIK